MFYDWKFFWITNHSHIRIVRIPIQGLNKSLLVLKNKNNSLRLDVNN